MKTHGLKLFIHFWTQSMNCRYKSITIFWEDKNPLQANGKAFF